MADDKKNIPEAAPPTEAPAPAVENAAVPEQPAPEAALTDAETVMLEHEGQAALFEMGEAVPDLADAVTHAEGEKPAVDKGGVPAGTEVTPEPSAPRDATRAEKEEIVYLNLSDLHPFKIIPLASGTMRRCRGLWSRSRQRASISPRWCVPVRMAAMRSSQATAASGQVSLPDLRICRVSSAT